MTTPVPEVPDDDFTFPVQTGTGGSPEGVSWYAAQSEEDWREQGFRQPMRNSFNPLGGLLGAIANALMGIPEAIGGIFGGLLGPVAGLMGQRWQQIDDLQDSSQRFEGVQVWGARYMTSDMSPTTTKTRAPFNGNIHNGQGVTYSGSEIVLNSRGLFKVDAQCFFSWVVGAGDGCYMDIVVRAPNGTQHSRKPAISRTSGTVTVFNSHTFGVPAAGYRVSVEVSTDGSIIGATRVILGGKGYTSLVVNKWSTEPD